MRQNYQDDKNRARVLLLLLIVIVAGVWVWRMAAILTQDTKKQLYRTTTSSHQTSPSASYPMGMVNSPSPVTQPTFSYHTTGHSSLSVMPITQNHSSYAVGGGMQLKETSRQAMHSFGGGGATRGNVITHSSRRSAAANQTQIGVANVNLSLPTIRKTDDARNIAMRFAQQAGWEYGTGTGGADRYWDEDEEDWTEVNRPDAKGGTVTVNGVTWYWDGEKYTTQVVLPDPLMPLSDLPIWMWAAMLAGYIYYRITTQKKKYQNN